MTEQTENLIPSGSDTLLTISGFGGLLYQARGLTQTLEVISAATHLERTINGRLIDLSDPVFRKYGSKITCSDVYAPPLDGIWPGMEVTVGCAVSLAYLTGASGHPYRSEVSGSAWTEGDYTFYRPSLDMRILKVETHFDEWKCVVGWSIELEEI